MSESGCGKALKGDTVQLHYRMLCVPQSNADLANSIVLEDSRSQNINQVPFCFTLGQGVVLECVEQTILGMQPGETRQAPIFPGHSAERIFYKLRPSHLDFGSNNIVVEVTLLKVGPLNAEWEAEGQKQIQAKALKNLLDSCTDSKEFGNSYMKPFSTGSSSDGGDSADKGPQYEFVLKYYVAAIRKLRFVLSQAKRTNVAWGNLVDQNSLLSQLVSCRLNAALCFLRLKRPLACIHQTTKILQYWTSSSSPSSSDSEFRIPQPLAVKALFRRSSAHLDLSNFEKAREDCKQCLLLDAQNVEAKRLLQNIEARQQNSVEQERKMYSKMLQGLK